MHSNYRMCYFLIRCPLSRFSCCSDNRLPSQPSLPGVSSLSIAVFQLKPLWLPTQLIICWTPRMVKGNCERGEILVAKHTDTHSKLERLILQTGRLPDCLPRRAGYRSERDRVQRWRFFSIHSSLVVLFFSFIPMQHPQPVQQSHRMRDRLYCNVSASLRKQRGKDEWLGNVRKESEWGVCGDFISDDEANLLVHDLFAFLSSGSRRM